MWKGEPPTGLLSRDLASEVEVSSPDNMMKNSREINIFIHTVDGGNSTANSCTCFSAFLRVYVHHTNNTTTTPDFSGEKQQEQQQEEDIQDLEEYYLLRSGTTDNEKNVLLNIAGLLLFLYTCVGQTGEKREKIGLLSGVCFTVKDG